jgi:TolB protein
VELHPVTDRTIQILAASATLCLGALAGCGGSSGASSGKSALIDGNDSAATRPVWFAGSADRPAAGDASMRVVRRDGMTGLYGELGGASSVGSGTLVDGQGNLIQVTAASDGSCFHPDIDRTGRLMVYASTEHSERSNLYVRAVDGRTQRQITMDPADDEMPVFSPDGGRVAFASNRHGQWDIFVTGVDGGPAMRLTESSDHEIHPSWSPDGQRLAYCRLASHNGRWEIWMVDFTSNVHQFLAYGLFPRWNPDPALDRIVYQRARERGSRLFSIWTLDLVDGEATNKTEIVSASNAAVVHPAWSPDGRRIAFGTIVDPDEHGDDRPTFSDIWIVNADGTGRVNLTNGESLNLFPVWSVDGVIYFLSDRTGNDNIWAMETSRTLRLGAPANESFTNIDPLLERTR